METPFLSKIPPRKQKFSDIFLLINRKKLLKFEILPSLNRLQLSNILHPFMNYIVFWKNKLWTVRKSYYLFKIANGGTAGFTEKMILLKVFSHRIMLPSRRMFGDNIIFKAPQREIAKNLYLSKNINSKENKNIQCTL